jgi:hypothetical protein
MGDQFGDTARQGDPEEVKRNRVGRAFRGKQLVMASCLGRVAVATQVVDIPVKGDTGWIVW